MLIPRIRVDTPETVQSQEPVEYSDFEKEVVEFKGHSSGETERGRL
jgi:hypothetical protein